MDGQEDFYEGQEEFYVGQEEFYEGQEPLKSEEYQFRLGTYDVVIMVQLPHFSTPYNCNCEKNCEGITRTGMGDPKDVFNIFKLLFQIRFHADGTPQTLDYTNIFEETCANTGYVSTFFLTCFENKGLNRGITHFSLRGVLGIVDVDGSFCKRQTVGASYDIVKDVQKHDSASYEIGLERFLKRDDILAESDIFLPNDTLTVRCEITFSVSGDVEIFSIWNSELFESKEIAEEWFHYEEISDEETNGEVILKRYLILNENSPLGICLKEKSSYFRSLFQTKMKEGLTNLLEIQEDEFKTFRKMISFIRFGTLDHVRNIEECADLYVAAGKYDVPTLCESCRTFFKQNMRACTAAELLMLFDLYNDIKMKDFTILYLLINWYEVKLTEGWKLLEEERTDLIRGIFCFIDGNCDDVLLKDNECLKAFKEEMGCFCEAPINPRTSLEVKQDKTLPDIVFISLLSSENQEILIEFVLRAAYEGYETANNMGYFEYKDFIYVKQEDLVREIMRLVKKESLKQFLNDEEALENFKMSMQEPKQIVLSSFTSFFDKSALDLCLEDKKNSILQSVLDRWFEITFSEEWKIERRKKYDENVEYPLPKSSSNFLESKTHLNHSSLQLKDLNTNNMYDMGNQLYLIVHFLTSWNADVSYQFLSLAMEARLNLYKQSLFVFKEKEKLSFTNHEVALKFTENNKHTESYDFCNL